MNEIAKDKSNVPGVDLDVINTRLIIDGIINVKSQMHIGTGDDDTEFIPQSGILMTNIGGKGETFIPYIPKSSIKGVLRSEAERIAKTLVDLEKNPSYICSTYPNKYCKVGEEDENGGYTEPCVVCKIFGGEDLASHIIFTDGLPTDDTIKDFETKLKPGITIDRKKQVTRDKSLFFVETLQPGAKFKFKMIINNISKETKKLEFKLLKLLFTMVKLGLVSIGGKRSTGMGSFALIDTTVKELRMLNDFLNPDKVESIDFEEYFEIR